MKRKIALLLAGAMTLSSLPVNVFAATNASRPVNTRLTVGTQNAANRTAFSEAGVTHNGAASGTVSNNNDVNHWMQGQDLIVEFPDTLDLDVNQQIQFEVALTNAQWYFNGGTDLPNLLNPNNPGVWNNSTRTFTREYSDTNRPEGRTNGSQFLDYTLTVNAADPGRATVNVNLHDDRIAGAGSTDVAAIQTAATRLNTALNASADVRTTIADAGAEGNGLADFDATTATTKSDLNELRTATTAAINGLENSNQTEIDAVTSALNALGVRDAIQEQGFDFTDFNVATATTNQLNELLLAIEAAQANIARPDSTDLTLALAGDGVTEAINDVAEGDDFVGALNLATASSTQIGTLIANIDLAIIDSSDDAALLTLLGTAKTEAQSFYNALLRVEGSTALSANLVIANSTVSTLIAAGADDNATLRTNLTTVLDRLEALNNLLPVGANSEQPENTKRVMANDAVRIPLVVRTTGENQDSTVRVLNGIGVPATGGTTVFATTTESGATTARVANPQTGRDRLDIPVIGVFENRVGALPTNGTFELVAPSGFVFNRTGGNDRIVVTAQGSLNGSSTEFTTEFRSDTVLRISYENLATSPTMSSLAIEGVELVSTNTDNVREGDVSLSIRSVGSPSSVTNHNFVVGRVSDWNVNMSVIGEVPQLINGRLDGVEQTNVNDDSHKAATVKIEESINNAWWAERTTTLTLPEEVRVRKLEFKNIRNLNATSEAILLEGPFYNNRHRNTGSNVRINDNVITISGLTTAGGNNTRASFEMDLWLNVESGYTGNIDLTLGGSAINNSSDTESVRIATAVNPVQVNAEVTNVKVGYQFVPVGNFTITETVAGALLDGEQVFITVTDEMSNDMHIASGFDWEVTEGDLRIRNVRTGTNLGLNNNNNNNNVNVSFEIDRESSRPSTIEFSNVQLRMANTAPISNADAGYDLVVWGPAVAANFDGVRPANDRNVEVGHADYINSNDFFRTAGIRTNYINVQGSGSDILTNVVRVTAGSDVIMVGDQPMQMDTAAYVSEASNSMMVPVRFVSVALGVDPSRVLWDAGTSTVTIDAGERIIQFQTNSNLIRINGIEMPMLNANGEPVYSEVRDERAFIPFRALGEALNVHVAWEADSATAIFDPTREPVSLLTDEAELAS